MVVLDKTRLTGLLPTKNPSKEGLFVGIKIPAKTTGILYKENDAT